MNVTATRSAAITSVPSGNLDYRDPQLDIISKIYFEDRFSFFEEYFSQVLFYSFSKIEKWNKMKLKKIALLWRNKR